MKRFLLVALLLAILSTGCARSPEPPAQGPPPAANPADSRPLPTCALLDLDRSPLAALLQVRLLQSKQAIWLERDAIDTILREQELQALFSPEGGTQRAALGKLLKADLLVLLRSIPVQAGSAVPRTDLVACETKQGLRLSVQSLPASKDADADVKALEQLVHQALAKRVEQLTEICAVPPFVSNDLGYQFDYLKAAYAKLLEQMLLERKGVLVVELAEAQAIAKEVALSGEGALRDRQLPLYLLGEYRNEGKGDGQRVAVALTLKRGEKPMGTLRKPGLSPNDVPPFLRQATAELIDKVIGSEPPRVDPAAEAKQLAERAGVFQRLGNWEEALALIEASLLLKPDREDLHHDAVVVLGKLTRRFWLYGSMNLEEIKRGLNYYLRGIEHLELFLQTAGDLTKYRDPGGATFVSYFRAASNGLNIHPHSPKEIRDEWHCRTFFLPTGRTASAGTHPCFFKMGWPW